MTTFLDDGEIKTLTGKSQKSKQVEQLRKMGVPFHVNAAGRPVVARVNVEGGRQQVVKQAWRPSNGA